MCKRYSIGTYLRVNALQDNAQPFFFPETITVGHFLYREVVVFLYMPEPIEHDKKVIADQTGNPRE